MNRSRIVFFRITLIVVAASLALLALRSFWKQHEKAAGLDFYIYFVNSQLPSRDDIDNIYAPEVQARIGEEYFERAQRSGSELRKYDATRRRRMDSVSSPFLYTALRWVSRDYDFALIQYHVLILASFICGVILLCRRAGLSWVSTLLLIAGLLHFYRGFEADLRVGNVNSIQLLMIGIAVWSPPFVAGAILGLLILFKPNVIYVAILLLLARTRVREVAGALTGAAIAFLIASLSYGSPRVWIQWVSAANQFWHRLPVRTDRNVTPALSLFHEYGTWPSYAIALVLLTIAAVVIRKRKVTDDLLVIGLGIIIYLLSATVVWLHYMVLVLPLAIALMRWRLTAIVSILALAALAEEPFEMLTRTPVYPNDAWLIGPALAALYAAALCHPRLSGVPERGIAEAPSCFRINLG